MKNKRNLGSERMMLKLQKIFLPSDGDNVRHGVWSTSTLSIWFLVLGESERENELIKGNGIG